MRVRSLVSQCWTQKVSHVTPIHVVKMNDIFRMHGRLTKSLRVSATTGLSMMAGS